MSWSPRTWWALAAAVTVIALVAVAVAVALAPPWAEPENPRQDSSEQEESPDDDARGDAEQLECPAATRTVSGAEELHTALRDATRGDVIQLRDGTYGGNFVATASGTETEPIWLCGRESAILEAGGIEDGYVMHLDGAKHWRLVGFTVRNGQKGVMADGTVGSVIHGLTVTGIGDEAIHLRNFSTDSTISGNTISSTGLRRDKFGEGIYIGTAESNWCDISGCEPDRSDRNTVTGNTITGTTAEAIDVKEGTANGTIRGNSFDGSGITAADSWVDVKGNDWLIESNTGVNSPKDGFQTHEILDEWGDRNTFRHNTAMVNGPGMGFALTPEKGNVVECSNTVTAADEGLSNTDCVNS